MDNVWYGMYCTSTKSSIQDMIVMVGDDDSLVSPAPYIRSIESCATLQTTTMIYFFKNNNITQYNLRNMKNLTDRWYRDRCWSTELDSFIIVKYIVTQGLVQDHSDNNLVIECKRFTDYSPKISTLPSMRRQSSWLIHIAHLFYYKSYRLQ